MVARTLIAVVVLGVVLGGCAVKEVRVERTRVATPAVPSLPARSGKCIAGGPACDVVVTVNCDSTGACSLDANPDFVSVAAGQKINITWKLAADSVAAGYRFDDKRGIVIRNTPPNEFRCNTQRQGQEFHCVNTHSQFGVYKYDVNVVGADGPLTLDPWVIND